MASNWLKPFQDLYQKAELLEEQFFDRSFELFDTVLNFRQTTDPLESNSSQAQTMHTLEVTMLGPTGVGKTSLMAAMYDQFAKNIGETNLQLLPDEESEGKLQDRLIQLKILTDSFKVNTAASIEGSVDPVCHTFALGLQGKKSSLELKFWDYPGSYHVDRDKASFVKARLSDSVAVMLAIHTPALMEKNAQFHEVVNTPTKITNLFRRQYENLDSPRLVILTPFQCEKYVQNDESRASLLSKVKEEYQDLLDFLASPALKDKVSIIITPVQTVGSVVFSRLEQIPGQQKPEFYFRKVGHNAKYCPQDTDQPLRYLLRFVLKLHVDQRQWKRFNFIRQWFQSDEHLVNAVRKFAKGCKETGGFQVLQGQHLLKA